MITSDHIYVLETSQEMAAVEDLQRLVWPGNETEIVPAHLLLTIAHNGGLVLGAYAQPRPLVDSQAGHPTADGEMGSQDLPPGQPLIGFSFGFLGLHQADEGLRLKHCSHMLGVHPDCRSQGVGFALKRAQWQMVRGQGVDHITWTYDPLLSRNAHLNIARLGAVCNTYHRNEYGEMRDALNVGLPSDRFQVDWRLESNRVFRRLSKGARPALDLAHFLAAGAEILNPSFVLQGGLPRPPQPSAPAQDAPLCLVEIPEDFLALKAASPELALEWRLHTRALFENLFAQGYLVTDFIHLPGNPARSFYVLSYGEANL